MLRCGLFIGWTLAAGGLATAADNWPHWRGPQLDGTSAAVNLPSEWGPDRNIVWKAPLPSWSAATPIVWRDRVFVTSPTPPDATPRVGRTLPNVGREHPGGDELLLLCFDARTGKPLWQRSLGMGNKLYAKQNMASPSPTTDGQHVFALTGTGMLHAFTLEGQPTWQLNLPEQFGEFALLWGYASSPTLVDGKLIVQVLHGSQGGAESYVLALDPASGRVLWRTVRTTDATQECPDAYTTPVTLRAGGQTQILVSGADWITAYRPEDGGELWRCAGLNPDKRGNYRIVGTPVVAGDLVIAPSRNRPIVAVRGGGSGDVSSSNLVWSFKGRGGPDVPSPVSDGKLLFVVDDRGLVQCLNVATGEVIWGPQRTATGTVSASPLLADGKLYVTNEQATTTVLAAEGEFKVLATNEMGDAYTIASLAATDGRLYLRTSGHLVCIGR